MDLVGVTFKSNGKIYYFDKNNICLNKNDYCIVETDKGLQFAKVEMLKLDNNKIKDKEIKKVIRKATKKDYDKYLDNLKSAKIVLNDTKQKIIRESLPMRILDTNFAFDKKQLLINFVADERVDFRNLVKYLASKYKTHIELHQIGVRDKAKEIGGIGQCGLMLCCKSFKRDLDVISINMAKNQNISLNPTKVNGSCGRLLCCLAYEDQCYRENRKQLPQINEEVIIDNEKYKVAEVDILNRVVKIKNSEREKVIEYDVK